MPASPILLHSKLPQPRAGGPIVTWGRARAGARALALGEYAAARAAPLLVLTTSVEAAETLAGQLRFFCGDAAVVHVFPDPEVLPYDHFSPHPDLSSQRMAVLRELDAGAARLVVASATTLLARVPPAAYLRARSIALATDDRLTPEALRARLEDAGYQRVGQATTHGDYAVRGSLVDFFPTGRELPVRVDFLDDRIESLREFDPDTQLSVGRVDRLDTLPARELPSDAEAIRHFRGSYRARFEGDPTRSTIYREVSEGRLPGGIESYLPLFFETTASFWDYLPADLEIVCDGDVEAAQTEAWRHVEERHEQLAHDVERPILRPDELFCSVDVLRAELGRRATLALRSEALPDERLGPRAANLPVRAAPMLLIDRRNEDPAARLRAFFDEHPGRLLICAESGGRRELVTERLRDAGLALDPVANWDDFLAGTARPALAIAPLDGGFVTLDGTLAVLTEAELSGEPPRPRRRRRRVRDPESIINDLTDLRPGAPVVHADHGVGRYVGLTTLAIDDAPAEFVTLEYAGGDRLHVPVGSLHLISRYTGAAPEHAPLHRLGTDQWAKARRRAAEKIRDVAAELLELYARRAARAGRPSRLDPRDYEAFAAGFPFTPTEDQSQAIDAVIGDLTASAPMDRLICGDVGFGKTEVALRAAFVAVSNGRQVAVVVPTTLLAQQHYQTFVDRFADWPVNVELLSRFRSAADARRVGAALAEGRVDIVIGTHRLLQPSIGFKDLGLVIIDEEQRFGVRHKEQLKALRAEVDILTLTATPIPRTLNMALGGLRELSLITTPPEARLSIKTFVTPWDGAVIREACLREMKRGGQVYFVHNRVEDIERVARDVAALLPEARLEIAHGQMRERELERIMLDFYHRRFHVLVCTSIIESGLDVPTANTIIINRADRFGLAQLHQLRGRVGRSHHQAFAYLLAPPREALTDDAVKRLDAIESLEDLGAGFVLATHDLEIRGAGELLGDEQSGQIQEIGFSLYNDMLGRTIEALRAGLTPDAALESGEDTELNLHLPALIPDDYMPDVHLRLVHYKRIASAADDRALAALREELADRFGPLPPATRNLFVLSALRREAARLGLRRVELGPGGGRIEFGGRTRVEPAQLVALLESAPERYSLDARQRLRVRADLEDPELRFGALRELIGALDPGPASGGIRASA